MIRAILENRKSQTRRVIKPQPPEGCTVGWSAFSGESKIECRSYAIPHQSFIKCPFVMRQKLWVKETFRTLYDPATCPEGALDTDYRADGIVRIGDKIGKLKWKPSIFMPRYLSRITLEITGVRVERLKDISIGDCIAEGVPDYSGDPEQGMSWPKQLYQQLWESINGKGSWEKNPWVWCLTFKKL